MGKKRGNQCPFCQLISNPDQLNLVGETENFYAWLEVNPRAKGHTMVVPKEHFDSIMDLDIGMYQEGMVLARKVVEKAEKGLGAEGASITINIEETGGQMMPHAYIQVFPRFEEEENSGTPTGAIFPQKEELQNQLGDIKEKMSSIESDFGEKKIEPHPESQKFQKDKDQDEKGDQNKKEEKDKDQENSKFTGKSYSWQ